MKTYQKQIIKKIPLVCFILVMATLLDAVIAKTTFFVLDPVPVYPIAEVYAKQVEMYPKPESPIKEYVLREVYKAGLNPDIIDRLITCESQWNEEAQIIESNGTISSGLWQINSIHKDTIKPSERLDYKASTKWAINKIKKDGFNAWSCYEKIK